MGRDANASTTEIRRVTLFLLGMGSSYQAKVPGVFLSTSLLRIVRMFRWVVA